MSDATATDPRLTIGGNEPPLHERLSMELLAGLEERHHPLVARFEVLLKSFETLPTEWRDEETQGKAQELLKMMRELSDAMEAQRRLEKAPWERLAAQVDAFFKNRTDQLDKKDSGVIAVIRERIKEFLEWKRDEEKRARERRAEAKRQEAARAAEAARQKEAERQERLREQERQKQAAEEARKKAAHSKFLAEKARLRAQRLRRVEAYLNLRAVKRLAAEADAKRAAERAEAERERQAALRKQREDADREAHRLRLASANSRRSADASDRKAASAAGDAKSLQREITRQTDTVQRTERQAERLEDSVNASPAELSRTRGEYGSVGSLGLRWTWRYEDPETGRAQIPLERIRGYINPDAIDAAISKFVQDGGRELDGVRIFQETEARVK